jgi:hypothetical protein
MTGLMARPRRRPVAIAIMCLSCIALGASSCSITAGADPTAARASASTSSSSPPPPTPLTASTVAQGQVVTDAGGARFVVEATPVMSAPYIVANSFLWSAAPGQDFLRATVTVTNPSASEAESLSDFDDLASGLATDVDFVMSSSDATTSGYVLDCGVDPAYPTSLCPISFGQGVTVDSDSANPDDRSVVTLGPGASAQIIVSYGPILASVQPATVDVYFDGGSGAPVSVSG